MLWKFTKYVGACWHEERVRKCARDSGYERSVFLMRLKACRWDSWSYFDFVNLQFCSRLVLNKSIQFYVCGASFHSRSLYFYHFFVIVLSVSLKLFWTNLIGNGYRVSTVSLILSPQRFLFPFSDLAEHLLALKDQWAKIFEFFLKYLPGSQCWFQHSLQKRNEIS